MLPLPAGSLLALLLAPATQDLEPLRRMFAGSGPIETVDLDEDGDLDLLGYAPVGISVFWNDGTGRFDEAPASSNASGLQGRVTVGQFAGGARLDLLVEEAPPYVLENLGGGVFTALAPVGASLAGHTGIRRADLEGDGDTDLYLVGGGAPDVLLLSDGSGGFTDGTGLFPAATSHNAAFVDADGDGDPDLVRRVPASGQLLRNDGTGLLALDAGATVALSSYFTIEPLDVDQDGKLDLAISGGDDLGWVEGDGTGNFTNPRSLALTTLGHAFLDWNGDGALDLVLKPGTDALTGLSQGLNVYVGDGAGHFSGAAIPKLVPGLEVEGNGFLGANVDGDGDDDLLVHGHVLLSRGEGPFEVTSLPPIDPDHGYGSKVAGDVDQDGDVDAAVVRYTDVQLGIRAEQAAWLENDGTGRFAQAALVPGIGQFVRDLGLVDVDGDGDLDLLAARHSTTFALQVALWDSESGAWTAPAVPLPSLSVSATSPAALEVLTGDLDDDGLGDAFVVVGAGADFVLLGDAAGGMTNATVSLPAPVLGAALGDLDGDGDLDAVLEDDQGLDTWLNPGGGFFLGSPGPSLALATGTRTSFALEDMDADGALDLVLVPSMPTTVVEVRRGDGGGGFSTTPDVSLPLVAGTGFPRPTILDGNGDGLPDLAVTGGTYHENLGGLQFLARPFAPPSTGSLSGSHGTAADFDRDGDEDLVTWDVFWGLRRQLAWRSWPRVGQPLTLELWGTPGGTWALVGGMQTASVPTRWGLLRLDLSTASKIGAGTLDGAGRASRRIEVPLDPTLLGLTFYAQGIVGTPLRFTGLESVPLSGS